MISFVYIVAINEMILVCMHRNCKWPCVWTAALSFKTGMPHLLVIEWLFREVSPRSARALSRACS